MEGAGGSSRSDLSVDQWCLLVRILHSEPKLEGIPHDSRMPFIVTKIQVEIPLNSRQTSEL